MSGRNLLSPSYQVTKHAHRKNFLKTSEIRKQIHVRQSRATKPHPIFWDNLFQKQRTFSHTSPLNIIGGEKRLEKKGFIRTNDCDYGQGHSQSQSRGRGQSHAHDQGQSRTHEHDCDCDRDYDYDQTRPLNADLLTQFANDHYDEIFRYCARRLPTVEDAKDATQEVFLRLAKSQALYDSREKPLAYLYTCARNVCIDTLRRARPISALDEADAERIPDPAQEHHRYNLLLADALSRLPAEEREVLELRYGQDLKMANIATILGKSRFTLYRIERRALSSLRKMMGDDQD